MMSVSAVWRLSSLRFSVSLPAHFGLTKVLLKHAISGCLLSSRLHLVYLITLCPHFALITYNSAHLVFLIFIAEVFTIQSI